MGLISYFLSEVKSARAAYLMSTWQKNAQAYWTEPNYKNFVKEGYSKVVWVYAAIREIYTSMGGIPWVAYRKIEVSKSKARSSKKEWLNYCKKMMVRHPHYAKDIHSLEVKKYDLEELPMAHPLSRIFTRPNANQTFAELIEMSGMYLNISGKSYLEKVKGGGKAQELFPIRPDRIRPMGDNHELFTNFDILDETMQKVGELKPDLMVFFRMPHPLNERDGFSPIIPATRTIDQENGATDWNKAFFQNYATPPGFLKVPSKPSPEDRNTMREEWRIMQGGITNAWKPGILWGEVDYKELGKTHLDMAFPNLKELTRQELCGALGVPEILLGITKDSSYNNYINAKKSFYEETVIPQMCRMRDRLVLDVCYDYGEDYYVDFDLSDVEALQENITERVKRLVTATGGPFMRPNEARQELGMEPDPAFDVVYYGFNATPVNEEGAVKVEGQEQQEEDEEEGNATGSNKEEQKVIFMLRKLYKTKAEKDENYDKRTNYWVAKERQRQGWDKIIQQRIAEHFENELVDIKKLAKENDNAEVLLREIEKLADFEWKQDWFKLIAKNLTDVIDYFGKQVWAEINKSSVVVIERKWDLWDDEVKEWVQRFIAEEVVQVSSTTKKTIRDIIIASYEAGEGLTATVSKVESLYLDQIIPNRSMVIARTETHAASQAGGNFAAKQTGIDLVCIWVSSRDSYVRDSHENMDGKMKGIKELWNVRGSIMQFPGDSSRGAKAEEVINCRCDQMYEVAI